MRNLSAPTWLRLALLACSWAALVEGASVSEQIAKLEQDGRRYPDLYGLGSAETVPTCPKEAVKVLGSLPMPPGNVDVHSASGRVFFTFHPAGRHPTKSDLPNVAVMKLSTPGTLEDFKPYPSAEAQAQWKTVLAVRVCGNFLWLLDHADLGGNEKVRPSLFQIDLETNKIVYQRAFTKEEAKGMLNDFVCSADGDSLFIADAGISSENYAIVRLDVSTNSVTRHLENHVSTLPVDLVPVIGGDTPLDMPWKVGVDSIGIRSSPAETGTEEIVFSSIYAKHFWIIDTQYLKIENDKDLAVDKVRVLGVEGKQSKSVSDGIICGHDGRVYVTDFEHFAITKTDSSGIEAKLLAQDMDLLRWPDGVALSSDGKEMFVASSAIHEIVAGNHHQNAPFHLVRIDLGACGEFDGPSGSVSDRKEL